jgi:hypothetical protein
VRGALEIAEGLAVLGSVIVLPEDLLGVITERQVAETGLTFLLLEGASSLR